MAESISEGTLKQFNLKVGEYIERDAELATIETDKIDVAVNAPESGTVKELLVNEEDTVTVGQDVAIIDTDGAPSEGAKESTEPSQAKKDQSEDATTALAPEPESKREKEPEPAKENAQVARKPEPSKKETPPQPQPAKATAPSGAPGNREERRVGEWKRRLWHQC